MKRIGIFSNQIDGCCGSCSFWNIKGHKIYKGSGKVDWYGICANPDSKEYNNIVDEKFVCGSVKMI